MPSISYAITVSTEHNELEYLIEHLKPYVRPEDEILVLVDSGNYTKEVWEVVQKYNVGEKFTYHRILHSLNNDFSQFKNFLKQHCSRDYIFFIDADEYPSITLLESLQDILESNPVDVILVPRVNTVEGLTQNDINDWGWRINEKNRVNWPDYQFRICKNLPNIKWVNKVHERLDEYKTVTKLPIETEDFALIHSKTIDRQRKQNQFYATI